MTERTVGPPQHAVTELEVDGRISVYSPSAQQLVALNETASDVWRLCDGDHDLQSIINLLATSYAVQPSVIAGDVKGTVDQLVALGLLVAPDAA